MYRRILAVAGVIALTLPASAALAATPNAEGASKFDPAETRGELSSTFTPSVLASPEDVAVVIQLEGDPVAVVQAEKGSELSETEKSSVKSELKQQQDAITGTLESKGAEVSAQMQSAYNGIQATLPGDQIAAVAELPGVVAVHPVATYTIDNAVSVPFLGVPAVWKNTGYTGKNVKVAIIDTGIDYTHAAFGGPGSVEDFTAAQADEAGKPNPAWYGPDAPRVKGGYDFVGDSYNADPDSDAYQPVPAPDDNPLDCNGHGTHVAGTTGGSGVNLDGTTYTGAYDDTTHDNTFRVGPGVAPEVDLYALKVFGCDGSTDVTVQAIDWAVDNGMDVINMSLGSSYGRSNDPSAVAATNAVGAGVVVVASSGNSGHNPYITGTPGAAEGVISVAAVDSAEGFPGATLTVDGTPIEAINANGADLSGVGPLTVVRLADIEGTDENEALGCSVEAYTANGITAGENQLAVSVRGECARAARGIYAQQAGAAAALMVNNAAGLPPFEGVITSNPDTGEEFLVTIPFLGVSQNDGPAFVTGATASLEATQISNPGFRGYASFTSGGPRNGDSALTPNIAAPGVSIVSAGVGTGAGSATLSGTSMAAPHVAGVAALSVQAHPEWTAPQISSTITATGDPEAVAGQKLTLGGVGLVDAAQAVATQVTATGDAFRTESGWAREAALSFGFQESWLGFGGIKTITVENHGSKAVTYAVSAAPNAESSEAKVNFSQKSVTVRPGGTAKVLVTVVSAADKIAGSSGDDQFAFREISGNVVLTASDSVLRVPYLVVPRSNSTVSASMSPWFGKNQAVTDTTKSVKLTNLLGALPGGADFYQWGLSDPKDVDYGTFGGSGYDLRAAGAQSIPTPDGDIVVFALNTHDRWSNAAVNEYDVEIDTNRDGVADWIVLGIDSGAVRAGSNNGLLEVFVVEAATGRTFAAGFDAVAPTDSSTVLLPFYPGDFGISGTFDYKVSAYSLEGDGQDVIDGTATFNASTPAVSNGQYVEVPRRKSASADVSINAAAFGEQNPLGSMVVVLDNKSGKDEALLIPAKK